MAEKLQELLNYGPFLRNKYYLFIHLRCTLTWRNLYGTSSDRFGVRLTGN